MNRILNINFLKRLDIDNLDSAIADEVELELVLKNSYDGELLADGSRLVSEMDSETLDAFKKVVDFLSFNFEEGFPVIKIAYDAGTKTFDLSGSYLRDQVATEGVTAIPDELPITVSFEFAGFETNEVVTITYLYNEGVSGADKDLLAEAGVILTLDGIGFNIVNDRDCKVFFTRPDDSAFSKFVIDYPAQNTIIPKEE